MAAAIHTWLLIYKVIKVKWNVKFNFSVAVATFQVLRIYLRLWGAVLEMQLLSCLHYPAKCYWAALHSQSSTQEEERETDAMAMRQAFELIHPWFTGGPWKKRSGKELSTEKRTYKETSAPNELIVLGCFFKIHEYLFYCCQWGEEWVSKQNCLWKKKKEVKDCFMDQWGVPWGVCTEDFD